MLIDTLTAKLTADASGFTPVMEKAGQQLRGLQGHGEAAGHGLTLVRRGFESLAIQAIGVSGPIGRISSGLLTLGAGSTTVLGVVAGIGLIAGAYKLASRELDHFNSLTDDAIKGAAKFLNSAHQMAVAARAEVAGRLRDAIEELKRSATPTAIVGRGGIITGYAPPNAGTVIAAQNAVHALRFELQQADDAVKRLEISMRDEHKTKEHTEITNDLANAYENFTDKISDLRIALQLLRPSFVEQVQMVRDMNLAFTQLMARQGVIGQAAPQLEPTTTRPFPTLRGKPQFVTANGVTAENPLKKTNEEMEKELKERGAEIGAAFIMAMAQGAKSASDFLKQVMLEIANIAIVHIFKLALGIASPSRVGIDLGKNFSYGLATGVGAGAPAVGGASGAVAARMAGSAAFSLNLSGMPPAMNPLAAARDQEYQRFFREGALVAKAAGFQFS